MEELELTESGKQREGTVNDADIAARLFEDNLAGLRILLADCRMTRSVAQAIQADGGGLTWSVL